MEQSMKPAEFSAPQKEDWGGDEAVQDWSADGAPAAAAPAAAAPVAAVAAPAAAGYHVTEDWSAATETSDWAAASTEQAAPAPNWGGSNQW